MTWNYRLMVRYEKLGMYSFEIHEVYYNKKGKPVKYTPNASDVSGVDMSDIRFTLNGMKESINKPILWMGDKFPEEFDYDEWIKNKKL